MSDDQTTPHRAANIDSSAEKCESTRKNDQLEKPPDAYDLRTSSLGQRNLALEKNPNRHSGSAGGDGDSVTLVALNADGTERIVAARKMGADVLSGSDASDESETTEIVASTRSALQGDGFSAFTKTPGFANVAITVTDEQMEKLAPLGIDKVHLEAMKAEMYLEGRPITSTLCEAMKNSRVLAIGENHQEGNALIADYAPGFMKSLKTAGATHLAIERVPGVDTPERDPAFEAMLQEAHKQGLKVVRVDTNSIPEGEIRDDYRNQCMAANVSQILDGDPDSKVIFWAGAAHTEVNPEGTSAGSLLKQRYPVCTVDGANIDFMGARFDSLFYMASESQVDFCIPTQGMMVADVPKHPEDPPIKPHLYGRSDLILFFKHPRD